MKNLSYFLMVAILGACTPAARTPVTQDFDFYGNEAYRIECNWTLERACYRRAEKICPNGYYLVDEDLGDSLFLHIYKSITVRCKA